MIALTAAVLVLLSAGPDELKYTKIVPLRLKVPSAWKHSLNEGTHQFDAPSKDASFKVDISVLQEGRLDPGECRDKLVKALGGAGWELLDVGGQPAARQTVSDFDDKKQEYKTVQFVGCNGKTKWGLSFTLLAKSQERFFPLADQIAGSIQYLKGK